MGVYLNYLVIGVVLFCLELLYFAVADKYNIIDKPNERSSHTSVVLRGGGVIFSCSMVAWAVMMAVQGSWGVVEGYLHFGCGLLIVAVVSFLDDIMSLPDAIRLVAQFVAMALMFWSMGIMHWNMWWIVAIALVVCVGATNVINFMDGVNGITAGYSLTVLLPLMVLNKNLYFIDHSFLIVASLGVVVFSLFNFRPKGKAKCFAGDVGSVSIAFIMLFAIGRLAVLTQDVTYLIFLLVYGVDGCLTICHRILLRENLGEAHRKHVYQLMANELKMGHVKVSLIYMALQLMISLAFIYLCPNTVLAHWIYLAAAFVLLTISYVFFKKKYYHLHEEYLEGLKK